MNHALEPPVYAHHHHYPSKTRDMRPSAAWIDAQHWICNFLLVLLILLYILARVSNYCDTPLEIGCALIM